MTPEELEWNIKPIQHQYQNLDLTFEQAEKIYRYEKVKNLPSDRHHFSQWEEWDYESTTFREILNDEQFSEYEKLLTTATLNFEQRLKDEDLGKINEIAFWEEQLEFLEKDFTNNLLKEQYLLFHAWFPEEQAKITYLKTEYLRFLNESKKELLTDHFRFNRTLSPNALKASILRHDRARIVPSFIAFKHWMDEPTKAITSHLKARFRSLPTETETLLVQKFNELSMFTETNMKKHFNLEGGWNISESHLTAEEEKEYRQMTWLLIDKKKYAE